MKAMKEEHFVASWVVREVMCMRFVPRPGGGQKPAGPALKRPRPRQEQGEGHFRDQERTSVSGTEMEWGVDIGQSWSQTVDLRMPGNP